MKTNENFKRHLLIMSLGAAVAIMSLMLWSCTGQKQVNTVEQAYELRLNGEADSARVLLEQMVLKDSTNAAAWYELARTKHHMGLGNPREFLSSLEDLQQTVDAAVNNDPENVTYSFYRAYVSFFRAYASLMMGQPDNKDKVESVITAYETVLKLKPDYYQAMLYLVEILGLPEDMGGDSTKAEAYAQQLEEMDGVYGAKARELRLPEDADRVVYWQGALENNPNSADVLEQLGKAYLYKEDIEQGKKYFEDAIKVDPERQLLIMDLARYNAMAGMQDTTKKETALPQAEELIQRYLDSDPIPPLQAFAYELSAKIKFGQGDNEGVAELREKAEALDPFYSKAFGVPPALLFSKPDEISHHHSYFFRPF